MPFDPSLPATGSPDSSAEMRGQLNGLKELIDAVQGITSAQVDTVATAGPGDPAAVSLVIVGNVMHLSFVIPRGNDGVAGPPGQQGPAFANAVIDSVGTLNPGENATVSVSFDGSSVHFSFGIPRGATGEPGTQGQPGEVTNSDLASAINGVLAQTSNTSNGVALLGMTVSDPPTQAEVQAVATKLDELITALRR